MSEELAARLTKKAKAFDGWDGDAEMAGLLREAATEIRARHRLTWSEYQAEIAAFNREAHDRHA
jgi:hypothetical protein